MNTWKVILATMFIFGTGVVTGGLLVRHSDRVRDHHSQPRTPGVARAAQPFSPGGMRFEFMRRMEKELDLNPEQREHIDKILKDSQERTKKILEPVNPRVREEVQKTKEQFREVLTPEQRARFDQLLKQQQQRPRDQRKPPAPRPRSTSAPTNSPVTVTNL